MFTWSNVSKTITLIFMNLSKILLHLPKIIEVIITNVC